MTRLQRLYRHFRRQCIPEAEAREIAPRLLAAAERIDAKYPDEDFELRELAMGTAIGLCMKRDRQ